jgi:hypothetical protein
MIPGKGWAFKKRSNPYQGSLFCLLASYGNKFPTWLTNKKGLAKKQDLYFWVDDGTRTHDPRHHKPVL